MFTITHPTLPTRRRAAALAALALLLAPLAVRAQSPKRITTASAVRVRQSPSTSAAIADTLSIGVVLDELERSKAPQRIGAQEDYWYRVTLPNGKQGWVFGGLTRAVVADEVEQAYVDLAAERLAREPEAFSFTDWTDLAAFLERVSRGARDRGLAAELELARLRAMGKALLAIPFDKQDQAPYKPWLDAQGALIVYNEPAGQFIPVADHYWTLQTRYAGLPIAERIAWEAAQIYLPGECEGYFPCYVASFNLTTGRYLGLYPSGPHADEVLDGLLELLGPAVADGEGTILPEDRESRDELRSVLTTTRGLLAKVSGPKRDRALELMAKIEAGIK